MYHAMHSLDDFSVDAPLSRSQALGSLLSCRPEQQARLGYVDTLREILQQPDTWVGTAAALVASREALAGALAAAGLAPGAGTVLLTGSGSSHHVGGCLAPGLGAALRVPVNAVPAGDLLTHAQRCLPPDGPLVVVHFARSGDSPESLGVLHLLLERAPRAHHVVITCNRLSQLAQARKGDPRILRLVLDDRTNDRSLVMTSSFTNLVLAGRLLGHLDDAQGYVEAAERLAAAGRALVPACADALARLAATPPRVAVYLGTGGHLGAARESGLKMLEMSAGRVLTLTESFLGLRHGPMSAVGEGALVVAYLSSDPIARSYEVDVLRELRRKQRLARLVVVGGAVPVELVGPEGFALECPARDSLGDDSAVLLDAVVGQLLGLFTCLALGMRPDAPSPDGTISRVVGTFTLHGVS
jgi:tagatose-6-phosphate ketose/aldose isomerase